MDVTGVMVFWTREVECGLDRHWMDGAGKEGNIGWTVVHGSFDGLHKGSFVSRDRIVEVRLAGGPVFAAVAVEGTWNTFDDNFEC